jgi:hypothetical protein
MLGGLKDKLTGKNGNKIKGLAVLMSRKLLDPRDFTASLLDNVHEVFGNSITCQLVSATVADQSTDLSPFLPRLLCMSLYMFAM